MFYQFINETTIKKAPKPLKIGGKDVFTNSEQIHNENGFFRLQEAEYPQTEKICVAHYDLKDNIIVQSWIETEQGETEDEN